MKNQRNLIFVLVLLSFVYLSFQNCNLFDGSKKASGSSPRKEIKKNIIVIMTDDQDDQHSLTEEIMPQTFAQIVQKGTLFKNSFVNFPWCCPSRASFLSGQCANNSGIKGNGGSTFNGGYNAFKSGNEINKATEKDSLPVWLQNEGYETALIGKYLNGWEEGSGYMHIPPGWNTWVGMKHTYWYYNYSLVLGTGSSNPGEDGTFDGLECHGPNPENPNCAPATTDDYQTKVLARKAVEFIEKQKEGRKPFFLWLTPLAIHSNALGAKDLNNQLVGGQFTPALEHMYLMDHFSLPHPPNFNEANVGKPKYVIDTPSFSSTNVDQIERNFKQRRAALRSVDDMVSQVLNALKEYNLHENTIIIFTSDNGFFHGEHRKSGDKQEIYDESIRVPLVIRGPGFNENTAVNQMVLNVDLTASILEWTGAKPTNRVLDGRSINPLLTSNSNTLSQFPWRSAFLVEGIDSRGWLTDSQKRRVSGIRSNRYMYAEHIQYNTSNVMEYELYDMSRDPYQMVNRYTDSQYESVKSWMQGLHQKLRGCKGSAESAESCWYVGTEPQISPVAEKMIDSELITNVANSQKNAESISTYSDLEIREPQYLTSREDVQLLQDFLIQQKLLNIHESNGLLDDLTKKTLEEFQKAKKLNITGELDSQTIKEINDIKRYQYELQNAGEF